MKNKINKITQQAPARLWYCLTWFFGWFFVQMMDFTDALLGFYTHFHGRGCGQNVDKKFKKKWQKNVACWSPDHGLLKNWKICSTILFFWKTHILTVVETWHRPTSHCFEFRWIKKIGKFWIEEKCEQERSEEVEGVVGLYFLIPDCSSKIVWQNLVLG